MNALPFAKHNSSNNIHNNNSKQKTSPQIETTYPRSDARQDLGHDLVGRGRTVGAGTGGTAQDAAAQAQFRQTMSHLPPGGLVAIATTTIATVFTAAQKKLQERGNHLSQQGHGGGVVEAGGRVGAAAERGNVPPQQYGGEHGAGLVCGGVAAIGTTIGSVGGGLQEEVEQTRDAVGQGEGGEMMLGLRAGGVLPAGGPRGGVEGVEQLGRYRHIYIVCLFWRKALWLDGISVEGGRAAAAFCLVCLRLSLLEL